MKISRLFAYAATGIITGLLLENKVLIMKQCAAAKARMAKKKAEKLAHNAGSTTFSGE